MEACSDYETNMTYCSMCKYTPKSKDPTQLTWLMKRHHLSRLHTTNLRKKSGWEHLDLSDEGFLEYYEKRVPYCDPINTRPVYMGYISLLKERIDERAKLEQQAIDMGCESD